MFNNIPSANSGILSGIPLLWKTLAPNFLHKLLRGKKPQRANMAKEFHLESFAASPTLADSESFAFGSYLGCSTVNGLG